MNDYFYNDSSFSAEIHNSFFVEIMIVDKTCPRKDLNFFHFWGRLLKTNVLQW